MSSGADPKPPVSTRSGTQAGAAAPLPSLQASQDRDEKLALLLAWLTDEMQSGRDPDLESLARLYPDLDRELRQLWAMVRVAEKAASEDDAGPASWRTGPSAARRVELPGPSSVPRHFGDYELLEELGSGGMGVVYKARQVSLGRIVALKMILRGELASERERARFRAEAEAVAQLDHPNLVPVHEVGEHEGHLYFTMKFVDGETLTQYLLRQSPSARESATLLHDVCLAVQYAHEHGVLHRDLKPSNVLIDREGRPHVSDFGLAKRVSSSVSLTRSGDILGTPGYMSPEQASGRGPTGPASDVYSLGAILYQMLTGFPPFQARTPLETVMLVLERDAPPPRLLNPRADRDLEMIALKCLQKPPALRYASARELAADVHAFLHDERISARSGLFSQVVARWFRETHHAIVLESWGLLWMWHSLAILVLCLLTNLLQWQAVASRWPYFALWTAGLGTWAAIFWRLRRRAGPVTFVERQIAHTWAASMITIGLLFPVEGLLGLPVLTLSPVLGLILGMVFLVKAGILSGAFYVPALAGFGTALLMAVCDRLRIPFGISLFGIVSAASFFFPGLKYYRQRARQEGSASGGAS